MSLIKIEYKIPPGSDRDSVAQFIADALECWGGQYHPEDPLFGSLRGYMSKMIVNGKDYSELLAKDA
jgi:hypothetical protein